MNVTVKAPAISREFLIITARMHPYCMTKKTADALAFIFTLMHSNAN